ncbi:DUF2637 domain-containing protein [Kutzneria buriramensis]|uniref:DUF2637 domain-containing protein n=1 Tax=Kutzneria buriramensis TaxID=1045776 RepID=UPI0035E7BFF8
MWWRRWLQGGAAGVVAAVAAYASYDHQWAFASGNGARGVPAVVWPLSVDGLLVLASLTLLDPALRRARPWVRAVVRVAFTTGVAVSLAANVAAADRFDWAGVLVAGWPPVALLLAVEILIYSTGRDSHAETMTAVTADETKNLRLGCLKQPRETDLLTVNETPAENETTTPGRQAPWGQAQRVMWEHYRSARAAGRVLTGAELDRIAGTRDYGRAVLARWRRTGRIPTPANHDGPTVDDNSTAELITTGPATLVSASSGETTETTIRTPAGSTSPPDNRDSAREFPAVTEPDDPGLAAA